MSFNTSRKAIFAICSALMLMTLLSGCIVFTPKSDAASQSPSEQPSESTAPSGTAQETANPVVDTWITYTSITPDGKEKEINKKNPDYISLQLDNGNKGFYFEGLSDFVSDEKTAKPIAWQYENNNGTITDAKGFPLFAFEIRGDVMYLEVSTHDEEVSDTYLMGRADEMQGD